MGIREELVTDITANVKSLVEKVNPQIMGRYALKDPVVEKFREINNTESHIVKPVIVKTFDGEIIIVPIADPHLGSKGCNIYKYANILNFINEIPNCYTVILGDATETATKTSVGLGMYDEDFDITEQLKITKAILHPLAAQGKILGIVTGNHEMRIAYMTRINPAELIAESLNIPYLGYQGYFSLKVGEQTYDVMATHGASGSASDGGKIASLKKLNRIADVDLYLAGHLHDTLWTRDMTFVINRDKQIMETKSRYYVLGGSYMEYWNMYPEQKGLAPAITGAAMIKLNPTIKDIEIIV